MLLSSTPYFKLKRFLPGLIILLVYFFLLEIAVRIFPKIQPGWSRERQWKADCTLSNPVKFKKHIFVPGLSYIYRPNLDLKLVGHPDYVYNLKTVPFMNAGFGIRDFPITSQPKVIVLGDSFCEGVGVDLEQVWVKRLEQKVGQRILNLGFGGVSTSFYRAIFLKAKSYFHPSLTIIGFFANDFEDRMHQPYPFPMADPEIPKPESKISSKIRLLSTWLFKNSFIYRLARWPDVFLREDVIGQDPVVRYKNYQYKDRDLNLVLHLRIMRETGEVSIFGWGHQWNSSVNSVKSDLREIQLMARSISSRCVLVYIPSKEQTYIHLLDSKYKAPNIDAAEKSVLEICRELDIPCLDMTPAFRTEAKKKKQLYYCIDGHWNAAGHVLASEIVYDWIMQNRWLKKPVTAKLNKAHSQ